MCRTSTISSELCGVSPCIAQVGRILNPDRYLLLYLHQASPLLQPLIVLLVLQGQRLQLGLHLLLLVQGCRGHRAELSVRLRHRYECMRVECNAAGPPPPPACARLQGAYLQSSVSVQAADVFAMATGADRPHPQHGGTVAVRSLQLCHCCRDSCFCLSRATGADIR